MNERGETRRGVPVLGLLDCYYAGWCQCGKWFLEATTRATPCCKAVWYPTDPRTVRAAMPTEPPRAQHKAEMTKKIDRAQAIVVAAIEWQKARIPKTGTVHWNVAESLDAAVTAYLEEQLGDDN